jgi:hypothetical protein
MSEQKYDLTNALKVAGWREDGNHICSQSNGDGTFRVRLPYDNLADAIELLDAVKAKLGLEEHGYHRDGWHDIQLCHLGKNKQVVAQGTGGTRLVAILSVLSQVEVGDE